jgi:hypothetical protein
MFQTNVTCYLWDLVDEGIDAVLDRLKGEAGVTGISVGLSCPLTIQLRPHANLVPRTFRSSGGVQFQAKPELYKGSRIQPVVASWLRKANPLANLAEACHRRGLNLRGWLSCCNSPVTIGKYPFAMMKDLFGDSRPEWLCPVNPDVREYLRALVQEASTAYPFNTLELMGLSFPFEQFVALEQVEVELGALGYWLRNLCFCESCRQAAGKEGIDVLAAARSAGVMIDRIFSSGEALDQSVGEFLADEPMLEALSNWRAEQLTSLLKSIKETCKCRLLIQPSAEKQVAGNDSAAMARNCDGLLWNCKLDEEAIEKSVERGLRETGDMARVELSFNAGADSCPDSTHLVRLVSRSAMLGVRSVNVGNYGLLSMNRLGWIKQATRYAQREQEE